MTDEREFETAEVSFDGETALAVGADGVLLTPPLEFDKPYVVEISAPGMLSALSRWSRSPQPGIAKLPDVVLRRLVVVAGVVVGRDDRPIAGATVIQSGDGPERTEATSDRDGRFEVSGVPEGPAFLFAEKDGHRFHGQSVAAGEGPVRIVLQRSDDPDPRTLKPLAAPSLGMTRAERLELAYRVLKPRLDARLAVAPPRADFWLMRELAHGNLPAALNYLDTLVASGISQDERDQQFNEIATAVVIDDPAEALAVAERIGDPLSRWRFLQALVWDIALYAPRSSEFEAFKAGRLASETAVAARGVADPSWRVSILGGMAGKLALSGKRSEARLLLDDARAALDALEPENSPWHAARVAGIAALIDPEQNAEKLSELAQQGDFWRLFADLHIARRRPRETEELLAQADIGVMLRAELTDRPRRWPLMCAACDVLAQVCIQMAPVDPARAERIATRVFESLSSLAAPAGGDRHPEGAGTDSDDLISDVEVAVLKGMTLTRMAERVAASYSETAARWLQDAAVELKAQRATRSRRGWLYGSPGVMATMLPVACRLDPAFAHELLWRSLALRAPRPAGEGQLRRADDGNLARLARLLGRYDLAVARQLLRPLVENNRGEFLDWSPADFEQVEVDGDALLDRARNFVDAPFDDLPTSRERLRLDVARRLSSVQDHIERDWPGFMELEIELIRESSGFDFHHARMDE